MVNDSTIKILGVLETTRLPIGKDTSCIEIKYAK